MRKAFIIFLLIVSLFIPVMNEAVAYEKDTTCSVQVSNSGVTYAIAGSPEIIIRNGRAYCSASLSSGNRKDYLRTQIILKQGKKYIQSWEKGGYDCVIVSGNCKVEPGKLYTLVQQVYVNGVRHHDHTVTARS